MVTQVKSDLTETFTDIKADLSLTVGQTYLLQNTSADGHVILAEAATLPTDGLGYRIDPIATWSFTVGSDNIYVRAPSGSGEIVVNVSD